MTDDEGRGANGGSKVIGRRGSIGAGIGERGFVHERDSAGPPSAMKEHGSSLHEVKRPWNGAREQCYRRMGAHKTFADGEGAVPPIDRYGTSYGKAAPLTDSPCVNGRKQWQS